MMWWLDDGSDVDMTFIRGFLHGIAFLVVVQVVLVTVFVAVLF